jgi:hypothetical protein
VKKRERQEEINNQLKQLKAREKETQRKADTRRKVIAGALALEHFARHPDSEFARGPVEAPQRSRQSDHAIYTWFIS